MNRRVDLTQMEVLRARKGAASPASDIVQHRPETPPQLEQPTVVAEDLDSPGVIAPNILPRKARARGEPKSPVTTRLTYSLQDRLFRAATVLGLSQQALIEEAIDEALTRRDL